MKIAKHTILLFFLISFSINISAQYNSQVRELRGVWVTTVKMIDYPSKRGLSSDELKKEFIELIEMHKENGMNAIFFQVRPAADAFFFSPYEPWSEWLTGKQGQAPEPYFDPLKFMIEETHKRDMQFHAWINPFRAVATIEYADIASNHITKKKPEWFFTYDINKYFNPGIPEVREYLTKIIVDIVKRYDVDGIHFDDYFYPYPKLNDNKKIKPLPDTKTFRKYNNGYTDIKDWRRNNTNLFIEMVSKEIKATKSWVIFGVGPGGVWRNKGYDPDGSNTRGLATYDYLYADILNWLKNDWLDYVAPQLYWYIGHKAADYEHLTQWWSEHLYGKALFIGIAAYNIDDTRKKKHWGNPNEVPNQLRIARNNPNISGFLFYKTDSFRKNPLGINDSLKNNFFKEQCFFPFMPQVDSIPPEVPQNLDKLRVKNEFTIFWDLEDTYQKNQNDTTIFYSVYKYRNDSIGNPTDIKNRLFFTTENSFTVDREKNWQLFGNKFSFVVTSFDKFHNESKASEPVTIKFKK